MNQTLSAWWWCQTSFCFYIFLCICSFVAIWRLCKSRTEFGINGSNFVVQFLLCAAVLQHSVRASCPPSAGRFCAFSDEKQMPKHYRLKKGGILQSIAVYVNAKWWGWCTHGHLWCWKGLTPIVVLIWLKRSWHLLHFTDFFLVQT